MNLLRKTSVSLVAAIASVMWPGADFAKGQSVVSVQSIQNAALTAAAPYTTFSTIDPTIVTLELTAPVSITASAPIPDGFQDPNGTEYNSFIRYSDRQAAQNSSINISDLGSVDLEVDMNIVRAQPYPAGTYTYNVLLTITAP